MEGLAPILACITDNKFAVNTGLSLDTLETETKRTNEVVVAQGEASVVATEAASAAIVAAVATVEASVDAGCASVVAAVGVNAVSVAASVAAQTLALTEPDSVPTNKNLHSLDIGINKTNDSVEALYGLLENCITTSVDVGGVLRVAGAPPGGPSSHYWPVHTDANTTENTCPLSTSQPVGTILVQQTIIGTTATQPGMESRLAPHIWSIPDKCLTPMQWCSHVVRTPSESHLAVTTPVQRMTWSFSHQCYSSLTTTPH